MLALHIATAIKMWVASVETETAFLRWWREGSDAPAVFSATRVLGAETSLRKIGKVRKWLRNRLSAKTATKSAKSENCHQLHYARLTYSNSD
jgi:hypothetical protein